MLSGSSIKNTLFEKSFETEEHGERMAKYCRAVGERLGMSTNQLDELEVLGMLHDIGKMSIPDAILHKPGLLTDEEWAVMRQHPIHACNLLSPIEFLRPALDIPYCHHENWDGSGYPRGLAGEEIPIAARIFAVVDVWDALISDRPYRAAWSADKAIKYIQDQAGKQFDPQVVKLFLQHMQDNQFFVKQESAG